MKEKSIDDVKDFQLVDNAMNAVGIPANHKANIYRLVAAVLHLGNITFQESTKDKKGAKAAQTFKISKYKYFPGYIV